MRSIIFTSLLILVGPALAANDGPERGCYERVYSQAHLAKNPAQIVNSVRLKIYDSPYDSIWGDMTVRFADQGRLRGTRAAGAVMDQVLICFRDDTGADRCAVECDGGGFKVTKQTADSLTFETRGLIVGEAADEGCGGSENMAEVIGQPVRYRLNRVDDAICEGN